MTNCIDTIHYDGLSSQPQLGGAARIGRAEWVGQVMGRAIDEAVSQLAGAFASFLLAVLEWQRRSKQRADLAALDDFMLKDIGLSRAVVEREASKGFWLP